MKVKVRCSSRLHFGLLSFGISGIRQFGGVGAMIEHPCVELEALPSEQGLASGFESERVGHVANHALACIYHHPNWAPPWTPCRGKTLYTKQIPHLDHQW